MKPAGRLAFAVLLSAATGWLAAADIGPFQADRVERAQRQLGDVRFVMGSGLAMKWLEMYVGGNLVAAYRDFDADEVHASPDGNYFLVISNRAYSSMAYAVLDRDGRLVFSRSHHEPGLSYCARSTGNNWYWVDATNPRVQFDVERIPEAEPVPQYLKSAMVRGCDGQDILLGQATRPRAGPTLESCGRFVSPPSAGMSGDSQSSQVVGQRIPNLGCVNLRTLTLVEGRRVISPSPPKAEDTPPASTAAPR